MQAEHRFVCTLPNGLHARPASMLAECASGFSINATLVRETGKRAEADLKSVLSVVGLDVQLGDSCLLIAEGDDAVIAIEALRELTNHRLEDAEDAAETTHALTSVGEVVQLPYILRKTDVAFSVGRSICPGVGIGIAVHAGGLSLPSEEVQRKSEDPQAEARLVEEAFCQVREDLAANLKASRSSTEADLLKAHLQITEDPALKSSILLAINAGRTGPQAVLHAATEFMNMLRNATSTYVRDRAVDVQDIAMQLLDKLSPEMSSKTSISLSEPSVVFAESLTANQLMRMNREFLQGLVLGAVGETSHTVILARSLGIPCIINVPNVSTQAVGDELVVVDGDGGYVIPEVIPAVQTYYEHELHAIEARRRKSLPYAMEPAVSSDGVQLEVAVNATNAQEIKNAVAAGADGIGLYRTEFLFLDRECAPTEEEQVGIYLEAVQAAEGLPIIFRTLDIGGDKPAKYLSFDDEENPFLGVRGLRLYHHHQAIFDTQVRALLRAAVEAPLGIVKIMAPMVSTPSEAKWFRDEVKRIQQDLSSESVPHGTDVPVGIMIEVPSAAMAIDQLSKYVDFFSIGTNDLCQYVMAADRGNQGVSGLCDPHHPAFLRVLRQVVDASKKSNRWIGVCGELGGRLQDLPLMLGLGLNEISASSSRVSKLKEAVRNADSVRCRELLDQACECMTAAEVVTLLESSTWRCLSTEDMRIIDAQCMDLSNTSESKEYAIKSAVDMLALAGRSSNPRQVEEAIWAREETYSTGLGHGIAVPHCKSDAVLVPTLTVVKLEHAVEWGAMDGNPVHTVLMLTVPTDESLGGGGSGHMKIFANLARKLMHEEFRTALANASDPESTEFLLTKELGLAD